MSDTTFDSPTLNSYLKKYITEETKNVLKRDGIVLQEKIALGKTGRITYHAVKGNVNAGQFQSRNIYMEIRKLQGRPQRIASGIKEIYLKGLQKSKLYKAKPAIKKASENIAKFLKSPRFASMLSKAGPGAMKTGAIAKTIVMEIGGYLATALGAVPGIGWAALGATAAGMLIYKYYFDDGPGGISGEVLAGAGKKTQKYRTELDKIFKKAFVEKAGFFDSLFGGEDDYSMVKKTRGESSEQLLRRLKGSDKLSDEEKGRAEELMALISQVQIATRIQQVGKKLKEFPNMDPNQVYGQVVGGLDPATGGNKPKPKPNVVVRPGGKNARQIALAKKLGTSIKQIQKKLMNYFKENSNTFKFKGMPPVNEKAQPTGLKVNTRKFETPDGKPGPETRAAIKAFQEEFNQFVANGGLEAKKLTTDGVYGGLTHAAVQTLEANKKVLQLSRLNPDFISRGTMVADRGATGIPGGGGKSDKKAEKEVLQAEVDKVAQKIANQSNGDADVVKSHPKWGEEAWIRPTLATMKKLNKAADDIENDPKWKKAIEDLKKMGIPKTTKESKKGKTTMNKTKLINMIKEEIERVLSERAMQPGSGDMGAAAITKKPGFGDALTGRGTTSRFRHTPTGGGIGGEIESDNYGKVPLMIYLKQDKSAGEYSRGEGKAVTKRMAKYIRDIVTAKENDPNSQAYVRFPRGAGSGTSADLRKQFWGAIQHHYDGKIPFYGTGEDTEEWSVGQQDGQPSQGIQPVASGTKEPLPPEMQDSRFTDGYKDQYARRDVAKIVRQRKAKQMRITSRGQLRKIQQMLVDAGFLKKEIKGRPQVDGSYGYNTMLAIEKFQNTLVTNDAMPQEYAPGKSNVDGLAGRGTIKALRQWSREKAGLTGLGR